MAILTAFFSMKGETIAPGMKIVNLVKGHTAVVAETIQAVRRIIHPEYKVEPIVGYK